MPKTLISTKISEQNISNLAIVSDASIPTISGFPGIENSRKALKNIAGFPSFLLKHINRENRGVAVQTIAKIIAVVVFKRASIFTPQGLQFLNKTIQNLPW